MATTANTATHLRAQWIWQRRRWAWGRRWHCQSDTPLWTWGCLRWPAGGCTGTPQQCTATALLWRDLVMRKGIAQRQKKKAFVLWGWGGHGWVNDGGGVVTGIERVERWGLGNWERLWISKGEEWEIGTGWEWVGKGGPLTPLPISLTFTVRERISALQRDVQHPELRLVCVAGQNINGFKNL